MVAVKWGEQLDGMKVEGDATSTYVLRLPNPIGTIPDTSPFTPIEEVQANSRGWNTGMPSDRTTIPFVALKDANKGGRGGSGGLGA